MSDIKHEHHILEAIDQLRRRKARPDADRICSYLQRRFAVFPADTISDLQRLVDADIVVEVEYKGNISYRNAAKWSRYAMYSKSREENKGVNQSLSSLVGSGIAELIVQEPDYLDFGVPRLELKKFLYEKDRTLFTEQHFDIIVQREVASGNLVILENGNYSLADHPIPTSPSPSNSNGNELKMLKIDSPLSSDHHSDDDYICKEDETEASFNATFYVNNEKKEEEIKKLDSSPDAENAHKAVPTAGFRVGVRRKRAKKVFDPSDNNIPTRKRGRPALGNNNAAAKIVTQNKSLAGGVCYLCHHQARNRRGQNEKLISCRDCNHRVHPSCTNLSESASVESWLCSHCKTCSVCSGTSETASEGSHSQPKEHKEDDDSGFEPSNFIESFPSSSHPPQPKGFPLLQRMVICGGCDRGFHVGCRPAPLLEHASSAKWFCNNCSANYMKPKSDLEGQKDAACEARAIHAIEAKVCSSFCKQDEDEMIDDRVPDASCWSVEQVFKYLSDQGFPEEAAIFKHHGIDGPSLLLMKRDDVLIELSLKLGPALKLYKQVKKLQIRRCEDYFFWP